MSATSSPPWWPRAASPRKMPPRRSRSITSRCRASCDLRAAVAPGAPLVHERFGSNLVFDIERGDRDKTEAAMAGAAKIVALRPAQQPARRQSARAARLSLRIRRGDRPLHALCHDPAAALSAPLAVALHAAHSRAQNPRRLARCRRRLRRQGQFRRRGLDHRVGRATAAPAGALDRDAHRHVPVRRAGARPRHATPAWASTATAASSPCRSTRLAALGGYLSNFAPSIPGNSYPQTITGLYRTPHLHLRVRGVYTNTVPVDAYRGSGRPEATWINERLIERGAHELGIDVVEMRRRNLIGARRLSLSGARRPRLRFRRSAGAARKAFVARGLSGAAQASRPSCAGKAF